MESSVASYPVEMGYLSKAVSNLDIYIKNHALNKVDRVLKKRQFTVFEDIRNSVQQGFKEGYVKLPTGTGKTVLFSQVVSAMDLRTLIVVPTLILIGQTGEKLDKFTDLEYGMYYAKIKDLSKNVTVITYLSLVNAVKEGILDPDDYELIILDEAHKAIGPKSSETIEKFQAIRLGFTATDAYSEHRDIKSLFKGNVIHSMSIIEAIREGLICRFKSIFAFTQTDLSGIKVHSSGEYDERDLERAINHAERNQSAVDLYKSCFPQERAIAFCAGVAHAHEVARLFNAAGISAVAISGATSQSELRDDILPRFRSGDIQVLCNAKILIEGFDEPKATIALNLHPTFSRVTAEQRGGRVLRLDEENPDKWAYIVDFVDSDSRKPMPITFPEVAQSSEASSLYLVDYEAKGNFPDVRYIERPPLAHLVEIENLKVIVNAEQVLEISMSAQGERRIKASVYYDKPSEGWETAHKLGVEIKTNPLKVKEYVNQYRVTNPGWFMTCLAHGFAVEHYSPELCALIRKEVPIAHAPEGWMTVTDICRGMNVIARTVKKYSAPYRLTKSEWFKSFRSDRSIHEYFSPELVTILRELIAGVPAPEGWQTAGSLYKELHIVISRIQDIAEKYRKEHSGWFERYRAGSRMVEHYSPDLVTAIKADVDKESFIPEGWMSANYISRNEIRTDLPVIKEFAERYRKSKPKWFANYKVQGREVEYYSPDLIALMKKDLMIEDKPEGWMSLEEMKKAFSMGTSTIQNFIKQGGYEKTHSEWIKKFRIHKVRATCYGPELVTIIKKYFNKE